MRVLYILVWIIATLMGINHKNRKTFKEFKSGLKKHKHTYNPIPYEITRDKWDATHYHACTHIGCNMVSPKRYPYQATKDLHKNNWADFVEFYDGDAEPYFAGVPVKYE